METNVAQEVDRRLQAILDQYPNRFSDDDIQGIRTHIERSVTAGIALHACTLPNEIGPHFDPRAMTRA